MIATKPKPSTAYNGGAIPQALMDSKTWTAWGITQREEAGKPTVWVKLPRLWYDLEKNASTTDPATWGSYASVSQAAYRSGGEYGIGFVFAPDGGFVGIDLDNCRDPETGEIDEWARAIIALLDSYTEVSPSGTGVKIFCKGSKPGKLCRRGSLEMYDHARFFTVTGWHLEETPTTVEERTEQIVEVYDLYLAEPEPKTAPLGPSAPTSLDHVELLNRAMNAKDGAKFRALWNGDTSGYSSPSEADLALCSLLWFWAGDRARVDRLFRQSGLNRGKWDRDDYRKWTLDKACAGEVYSLNGHQGRTSSQRPTRRKNHNAVKVSWEVSG